NKPVPGMCPAFLFGRWSSVNQVPVDLLKPHPKNREFFPDVLPGNIWQELVADIKENGIIKAAREAGLTHVPVVIRDVDPESDEVVALLIRDNLLRRQLNDMQVARLIRC
ncbi:MAG: ParB/RepB/Spo0J family partition protein, partial [Desulfofundulus sp.]